MIGPSLTAWWQCTLLTPWQSYPFVTLKFSLAVNILDIFFPLGQKIVAPTWLSTVHSTSQLATLCPGGKRESSYGVQEFDGFCFYIQGQVLLKCISRPIKKRSLTQEGGMTRNLCDVSLSTLQSSGSCSCHSGRTSQSGTPSDLPVRSRAGLFRASAFRLDFADFAEELAPLVSCVAVKLLLLGDDELRALASWETTAWWAGECCLQMGRSRGWGAGHRMLCFSGIHEGVCRQIPCIVKSHAVLWIPRLRGRPLNNFALWA